MNNTIKNYDLFYKYSKTRDISIRNLIFDKYQYLAELISKKYTNKGIEYEDIYQIACIGLIYAIDRFDVDKGYEFTSFATPTILGEIKKYFRDKGWSIKVPRGIQEIANKLNRVNDELFFKLNRAPTIKELAEELGCSEEIVLEAMEAGKLFITQSLNIMYDSGGNDKEVELIDSIQDNEDKFAIFEDQDFIEKSFSYLNELEKSIIYDRFYENMTQSEIAKKLNISQMTVSRIEKKSLIKLKKAMNS